VTHFLAFDNSEKRVCIWNFSTVNTRCEGAQARQPVIISGPTVFYIACFETIFRRRHVPDDLQAVCLQAVTNNKAALTQTLSVADVGKKIILCNLYSLRITCFSLLTGLESSSVLYLAGVCPGTGCLERYASLNMLL